MDITSLLPIGEHICSIWRLPTELLVLIASHLTQEPLLALSQVCTLFREIAAPEYFALLGFDIPRGYARLPINDGCCRALLVWRRTDAFVPPTSICFSVSQTTSDHHFNALRMFFDSLTSEVRRVYLHLYFGPYKPTTGFLRLLESIRGSGCTQLGCYGIELPGAGLRIRHSGVIPDRQSSIESLELSSALFFTPLSIDFTLSTIRNAPLVRLKVRNTSLTPAQWASFLKILDLNHLRELEVDVSCPAQSLVQFLYRHKVESLTIRPGIATRAFSPPRLSPSRHHRPMTLPHSLTKLDGPPSYVLSFLRYAHVPGDLKYLGIQLGQSSVGDFLFSDILFCTEHFPGLGELYVYIPDDVDPCALALPNNYSPTCLVKELTLQMSDDHTIVRKLIHRLLFSH